MDGRGATAGRRDVSVVGLGSALAGAGRGVSAVGLGSPLKLRCGGGAGNAGRARGAGSWCGAEVVPVVPRGAAGANTVARGTLAPIRFPGRPRDSGRDFRDLPMKQ